MERPNLQVSFGNSLIWNLMKRFAKRFLNSFISEFYDYLDLSDSYLPKLDEFSNLYGSFDSAFRGLSDMEALIKETTSRIKVLYITRFICVFGIAVTTILMIAITAFSFTEEFMPLPYVIIIYLLGFMFMAFGFNSATSEIDSLLTYAQQQCDVTILDVIEHTGDGIESYCTCIKLLFDLVRTDRLLKRTWNFMCGVPKEHRDATPEFEGLAAQIATGSVRAVAIKGALLITCLVVVVVVWLRNAGRDSALVSTICYLFNVPIGLIAKIFPDDHAPNPGLGSADTDLNNLPTHVPMSRWKQLTSPIRSFFSRWIFPVFIYSMYPFRMVWDVVTFPIFCGRVVWAFAPFRYKAAFVGVTTAIATPVAGFIAYRMIRSHTHGDTPAIAVEDISSSGEIVSFEAAAVEPTTVDAPIIETTTTPPSMVDSQDSGVLEKSNNSNSGEVNDSQAIPSDAVIPDATEEVKAEPEESETSTDSEVEETLIPEKKPLLTQEERDLKKKNKKIRDYYGIDRIHIVRPKILLTSNELTKCKSVPGKKLYKIVAFINTSSRGVFEKINPNYVYDERHCEVLNVEHLTGGDFNKLRNLVDQHSDWRYYNIREEEENRQYDEQMAEYLEEEYRRQYDTNDSYLDLGTRDPMEEHLDRVMFEGRQYKATKVLESLNNHGKDLIDDLDLVGRSAKNFTYQFFTVYLYGAEIPKLASLYPLYKLIAFWIEVLRKCGVNGKPSRQVPKALGFSSAANKRPNKGSNPSPAPAPKDSATGANASKVRFESKPTVWSFSEPKFQGLTQSIDGRVKVAPGLPTSDVRRSFADAIQNRFAPLSSSAEMDEIPPITDEDLAQLDSDSDVTTSGVTTSDATTSDDATTTSESTDPSASENEQSVSTSDSEDDRIPEDEQCDDTCVRASSTDSTLFVVQRCVRGETDSDLSPASEESDSPPPPALTDEDIRRQRVSNEISAARENAKFESKKEEPESSDDNDEKEEWEITPVTLPRKTIAEFRDEIDFDADWGDLVDDEDIVFESSTGAPLSPFKAIEAVYRIIVNDKMHIYCVGVSGIQLKGNKNDTTGFFMNLHTLSEIPRDCENLTVQNCLTKSTFSFNPQTARWFGMTKQDNGERSVDVVFVEQHYSGGKITVLDDWTAQPGDKIWVCQADLHTHVVNFVPTHCSDVRCGYIFHDQSTLSGYCGLPVVAGNCSNGKVGLVGIHSLGRQPQRTNAAVACCKSVFMRLHREIPFQRLSKNSRAFTVADALGHEGRPLLLRKRPVYRFDDRPDPTWLPSAETAPVEQSGGGAGALQNSAISDKEWNWQSLSISFV
jgi:hypothetical protein